METATITRRRVVLEAAALAAGGLVAGPSVWRSAAAGAVPAGKITLAWHTNIAPRWLDPLQHDGGATPDNFLRAVDDALIKNFREKKV
jgi:peptide/nickel transport system substrate-binding protein